MLGVNGSANKGQCGSLWWKGAQQERTPEVALGRLFRCFTRDGEVSDPTGATGSVNSLARP